MLTLQKQFLCALMFNAVSLSAMIAMGHDAGRMLREFREEQEKDDKADDFSKYKDEILIEKLHDRVDIRHLNIGKYDCCKPIKSTIRSYYQTSCLPKEKAYSEIRTIQSYIPSELPLDDKKQIFSQLIKQHSYVHHLMQILVQHTFEQFKHVKGSTIDALYTPDFTNDIHDLEKTIYTDAKKQFCDYLKIDSNRLFLLYLCHRASENSKFEKKEYEALNNSNAMKQIQIH
jgi:hypothetical protein